MAPLVLIGVVAAVVWLASKDNVRARELHRKPTRELKSAPRTKQRPASTTRQHKSAKKDRPVREGYGHAPPPEIPESRRLKGRAHIIDGDTIVVSKIKIRLAGIDAPELDQPWGQKSKWDMVRICKGHTITVELTGETSYDRLVGTCYLPDGRDIGAELIKAGLALDGGHYSKGKYRHLEPAGVRQRLKFYGHWR